MKPAALDTPEWDRTIAAFLAEKRQRSGSRGTAAKYAGILARFFGASARTPDLVTPAEVFNFAYGPGPSRREPSAATVNLRLAAISSLYRFLVRMGFVAANPCDRVQRTCPKPPPPRGLNREEIRRLLAAIPETRAGKRDKAIILTCILTGRRRSEIMGVTASDISGDGPIYYSYRGKGGSRRRRELPEPCFTAIVEALEARGKRLEKMADDEPLFDVSSHGLYMNFRRYLRKAELPSGGTHVLRHTAAKLRRDVGESVEAVSSFLDHGSLQVTTTYLRRLEGDEDSAWRKVVSLLN